MNDLRCRISVIDLYSHVKERLFDAGIMLSWDSFTAPKEYFINVENMIEKYSDKILFESCAESNFSFGSVINVGCVSETDLRILGLNKNDYGFGEHKQRSLCGCLAKKQILGVKPGRCPHNCIYCYWK